MKEQEKKRNEMEERLAIIQFAVNQIMGGGYLVNADGRILYANEKAAKMLGYPGERLVSLKVTALDRRFIGKPHAAWVEFVTEVRQKKAVSVGTEHLAGDGSFTPIHAAAHYIGYAGKEYLWVVLESSG